MAAESVFIKWISDQFCAFVFGSVTLETKYSTYFITLAQAQQQQLQKQ